MSLDMGDEDLQLSIAVGYTILKEDDTMTKLINRAKEYKKLSIRKGGGCISTNDFI